jgi:outer membrane protein OmpA-like peptidoglycan-associated protein
MRQVSNQILTNTRLILGQLDSIPPTQVADFEIFGFPEYSSDIGKLDAEQKNIVNQIVTKIVMSQRTLSPIVAMLVVGHADKARKKPINERETFEMAVSETRATLAKEVISDGVLKLGNEEIAIRILKRTRTRGEGAKFLWNRDNPNKELTKSEMERNRRVQIFLVTALLPEPPTRDPRDKRETRIDRALRLLVERGLPNGTPAHRTKRASCFLRKLKNPRVVDVFVNGRAISPNGVGKFRVISNEGKKCFLAEWNGNYDTKRDPLPQSEVNKFLGNVLPIIDGQGFDPMQSDENIMSILAEVLMIIDTGINQVDGYVTRNGLMSDRDLEGMGYTGDAIRPKLQRLYRDNLDNEFNIYSCWNT